VSREPVSKLSLLQRAATALAVVALVLLPALHAPHLGSAAAARIDAGNATLAVARSQDAAPCPLCVFVSQAHSTLVTLASAAIAVPAPVEGRGIAESPRLAGARIRIAAPPRAPPA